MSLQSQTQFPSQQSIYPSLYNDISRKPSISQNTIQQPSKNKLIIANSKSNIIQPFNRNNPNSIPPSINPYILRSCDPQLDTILSGLHPGILTQLYGQSGSGKTHLAMSFAIGCLSRSIPLYYLSTAKELHWDRFVHLAHNKMIEAQFDERIALMRYWKCSDGIMAMESIEGFFRERMEVQGRDMFDRLQIEQDTFAKARKQAEIANKIRYWSKLSHCGVLLINQASDQIGGNLAVTNVDNYQYNNSNNTISSNNNSNNKLHAALGPNWELQIDQNVMVTRRRAGGATYPHNLRQLRIVSSPKAPSGSRAFFRIESNGLVWVDGEEGVEQ